MSFDKLCQGTTELLWSCETWPVWRGNASGLAGVIFVDNSDHLQSHSDSEASPLLAQPGMACMCGGVHKHCTISTVLNHTSRTIVTAPASRGVVQANLVHIISATAIPVLITGPGVKKCIKPNRSANHNNLQTVGCHSEVKATSDRGLVKAVHLNVRLTNKALRINAYVEEKDPDFPAITETWI